MKTIALLFWGLTRGLKHTVDSINNNVIVPLMYAGYDVHVFLHTYYFEGTYSNERHGIKDFKLDFDEYKLLNPKYYLIDNQDEVKKKLDLKKYRTMRDHFRNDYQSNDFYILSLYSQQRVTLLFNKHKDNYEYCFFMRPDVLYWHQFDTKWLNMVKDNEMLIPNWATNKRYKDYAENDRFCVCKPNDAVKYGNIFDYLLPYSTLQYIVAEFFLGFVLNRHFNVKLHRVGFHFKRVLPNGKIMGRG